MAGEAGTDFSGVLCGRATWKEGIPIYGKQGVKALEDWLSTEGVKNIERGECGDCKHGEAVVAQDGPGSGGAGVSENFRYRLEARAFPPRDHGGRHAIAEQFTDVRAMSITHRRRAAARRPRAAVRTWRAFRPESPAMRAGRAATPLLVSISVSIIEAAGRAAM